jgi:hypothetical protein
VYIADLKKSRKYFMRQVTAESPFRIYLTAIERELQQGIASEHAHRPALKAFIESVCASTLATNEPKRIKCGALDFIVTKELIPLGYVEAKDIDRPKVIKANQQLVLSANTKLR